MTLFNSFLEGKHLGQIEPYSVKISSTKTGHELFLRFDSKDILVRASYLGKLNPWLGSLCEIAREKKLTDLKSFTPNLWWETFKSDLQFLELWHDVREDIYFLPIELLQAAIKIYTGETLCLEKTNGLVCKCFGVEERQVIDYLNRTEEPNVDGIGKELKAGMGCRSCVPQLKKWIGEKQSLQSGPYYKQKPRAEWLLEMDYLLKCFPEAEAWKMEIMSFQGQIVRISFDKAVEQKELEQMSEKLQDFLGAALDGELSFFLVRARHF